jgi:hypothetical protein
VSAAAPAAHDSGRLGGSPGRTHVG